MYIFLQHFMTGRLSVSCCLFCSQKNNLKWDLKQLREVWTNNFESSPDEDNDVEEHDAQMTGGERDSGEPSRVDEDPFEKELHLTKEGIEEQVRPSTAQRYSKPQDLDQLEE
jgi:hypothetical protein